MRTNTFKYIITLPYLLNALRKSNSWFRKIVDDPRIVHEEKRYIWIKKIAKYILWLHNVKIYTLDIKNWLDGPVFIASNHQSNMDGSIIFTANNFKKTSPCAFIAKEELKKQKKLYKFLSLIDVLFIDRDNLRQQAKVFKEANEIIKTPRSMVLFPEGTRNPDNKNLGEFKDGAFKLAQKGYVPIIPVTIYDSHNILNGSRFKRKNTYIIFHKPILPNTFMHMDTATLSKKVKKIIQSGLDNININNPNFRHNSKNYKKVKKEDSKINQHKYGSLKNIVKK